MFSANSSQVSDDKLFVEDVFSTYLYTGTDTSQTITNGIDLAGKGGLVWVKKRSATDSHALVDTVRGGGNVIESNTTSVYAYNANSIPSFTSSGFRTGINYSGIGGTYASWTFRKAPKFFDVVTYTGNSTNNRSIAHNLGVAPGMIIIKKTSGADDWVVYHRSLSGQYLVLNTTAAAATLNVITADATTFTLPTAYGFVNGDASNTYVAYLYAHDATSDGIIQCGSYTGNGSATGPVVTLGYEPQWVMVKRTDAGGFGWYITDTMRGMPVGTNDALLTANTADAELSGQNIDPTATGFQLASTGTAYNASGGTYIYMAIRRGPMRTPTLGTSVFVPSAFNAASGTKITTNITTDLHFERYRASTDSFSALDRLRGLKAIGGSTNGKYLLTTSTNAEGEGTGSANGFDNTGFLVGTGYGSSNIIAYDFRRAPGFMDVVCYTGTGVARTLNHNLGVVPELLIIKPRSSTGSWIVGTTFGATTFTEAVLNSSDAGFFISYDNLINAAPTSTTFSVGSSSGTNGSGTTYVAYLFASAPGVSKVGSYTGNGSSQTIDCGFAAGARFIMIKRTDSNGNWCVWDTARGIVSGDDPVLSLNNTLAESNTTDDVDAASTGFIVNSVSPGREINLNGSTYIYLAIA